MSTRSVLARPLVRISLTLLASALLASSAPAFELQCLVADAEDNVIDIAFAGEEIQVVLFADLPDKARGKKISAKVAASMKVAGVKLPWAVKGAKATFPNREIGIADADRSLPIDANWLETVEIDLPSDMPRSTLKLAIKAVASGLGKKQRKGRCKTELDVLPSD